MEFELNWIEFKYIEWNLNWIELNFNLTTFNSTIGLRFNSIQIQLKRNGIQIGGEGIENIFMNMMLKKKFLKR